MFTEAFDVIVGAIERLSADTSPSLCRLHSFGKRMRLSAALAKTNSQSTLARPCSLR
jgi:hypothetical protein